MSASYILCSSPEHPTSREAGEHFISIMSCMSRKSVQTTVLAAILVLVCTIAFRNQYYAGIITITAIAAILTMAVNLSAYAGVLMFGSGGLYGVGAYTYANMSLLGYPSLLGLLCGAAMSTIIGLVMIIASLRLRGIFFALSTLIGNLILSAMFLNLTWLTAGPRGMSNIPAPSFWFPGIGEVAFVGYLQTYLALLLLIAWLVVCWLMLQGRTGIYLEAIRNDEMLSTNSRHRHNEISYFGLPARCRNDGSSRRTLFRLYVLDHSGQFRYFSFVYHSNFCKRWRSRYICGANYRRGDP